MDRMCGGTNLMLPQSLWKVCRPLSGSYNHTTLCFLELEKKTLLDADVIQQMMEHVALNKLMPARPSPVKQKETLSEVKLIISNSPDSVLNQSSLSISNLSPDISEPSDHIHSSQFLINSHIGDCTISGPDSSSLSVNSNRDTASKEHDKDSLDRGTLTKHGDELMPRRNQKLLDVIPATEENTECMKQDVSHIIDASTVNGDDRNQASRDQHGDGVQPFSEVISLDADMDRRNTRMELSAANSNSCTKSLDADSVCSDKRLTNAATGLVDGVPSAPPVEIGVDHLSAELKKVDVARIKDLLLKRKWKRKRDIQVQAFASEDLSDEAWIERELESGIVVGPSNKQAMTLDGLSEDDWIERELESGIIVEQAPASKKQKLDTSCC
jgi:cyclin T